MQKLPSSKYLIEINLIRDVLCGSLLCRTPQTLGRGNGGFVTWGSSECHPTERLVLDGTSCGQGKVSFCNFFLPLLIIF